MRNKTFSKFRIKKCRLCGSDRLHKFLSLGSMPAPNSFLRQEQLKQEEDYYPLEICVCESCWLVQLSHVVPAKIMFKNYLYIPSTSTTMLSHFKTFAQDLIKTYELSSKDLVIDIGSNDGALLGYFKEREVKVLGVDPATNLVQVARLKGIDTVDDFFTSSLARKIKKDIGNAAVITATNVVAHIDNLNDLCKGMSLLLDKNGVFIAEFPYLVDLLEKKEFDTVYHEHLSYFAITPLLKLFSTHGLKIIDVRKIPVHGGSIRVYVAKKHSKYKSSNKVKEFIKEEKLKKLTHKSTYENFAREVKTIKKELVDLIKKFRDEGKKIIGYGASAKGNVLMSYCGITKEMLDYIVDSISYKQGRYTPGNHIPIYPESRLEKETPDYVLLLAWNFADEILNKQSKYRERGGQFIIIIPSLHIV
ncbi:MAG: methyltransferase domain-containing protein [Candidatus Roizmanbacteria bacterium]|nr:MAG: methyltransferase domain-containing protein [Candidatus Roizmanbacteria bacterium]